MLRQVPNYSNLPAKTHSSRFKASKHKCSSAKETSISQKSSSITIKFIGNVKENIQEIVQSLQCSEFCKSEVSHILQLYASKINKLRQERDYFKRLAQMQEQSSGHLICKLRKRVEELEQVNLDNKEECSCEKCTCLDEHQLFSQQFSNIHQGQFISASGSSAQTSFINQESSKRTNEQFNFPLMKKLSQQGQESILIEHDSVREDQTSKYNIGSHLSDNLSFVSQLSEMGDKLNECELMKIMLKYNFSVPELQQILQDYQNEHRLVYEMFDSQKQRDLYILGQKMQKSFRNKKVLSDVKKLSMMKSQTLNRSARSNKYQK